MPTAGQRRERLARARLYFVSDASTPVEVLRAALEGGADMLQLRDPSLSDDELLEVAAAWRALCPSTVRCCGSTTVPTSPCARAPTACTWARTTCPWTRRAARPVASCWWGCPPTRPSSWSAGIESGADQLSVGPVWETPTKPGRPAAGLEYVRHAAERRPPVPWFAIGGIDEANVAEVVDAGAERAVVVRAIRDAADPRAAAAQLRAALERKTVGAAQ